MRTTLDLDDDLLQAVKELAAVRNTTAGRVVSDFVRKGLEPAAKAPRVRNGVPLMPRRPAGSPRLTVKLVNELLDEP
jgi:hypothetical protein